MRITAITPEQEARFQEWREKWIKIGLSTEPADFDKAEKAALRAYALCGFDRPKIILRMGSPYGAIMGGRLALLMLRTVLPSTDQFNQQVLRHVKQQVEEQVWRQVDLKVDRRIYREVDWKVRQMIWRQIGLWIEQQVDREVKQRILQQVHQQVEQQVWDQVRRQVWQHVQQQVLQQVKQQDVFVVANEGLFNNYGGSFCVDWCAYVTFLRDVLGWKDPMLARFTIDEDLATSCGWVWWSTNILSISDRPSEIHLDAEGRLHSESGPSIAYRDGWKLYHVHGVAVPDFVIENPDKITVEHVKKERNAEVRRVMVSRMGLERFIRESGLKPIHSDDFGTLYRKEMPDDEPLVVVKVVNSTPNPDGSRKEYFLRVPPTMKRAREAVAWTFGMEEKEYRPATET